MEVVLWLIKRVCFILTHSEYRITPNLVKYDTGKGITYKSFKKHVKDSEACGPDNILGKELKMIRD